jgi:hypothetical protein
VSSTAAAARAATTRIMMDSPGDVWTTHPVNATKGARHAEWEI